MSCAMDTIPDERVDARDRLHLMEFRSRRGGHRRTALLTISAGRRTEGLEERVAAAEEAVHTVGHKNAPSITEPISPLYFPPPLIHSPMTQ